MKVIQHPAGIYQANCYIAYNSAKDGFVLDPGGDCEGILKIINDNRINVKFIILTHGHFDHIGAVSCLRKSLNVPVYMNSNDAYLMNGKDSGMLSSLQNNVEPFEIDRFLSDGDVLQLGDETLKIYETPGHTPGGISIKTGNAIFTGDTLFSGSIGRCDLPGGSSEAIIKSIKEKIMPLPDATIVYPGHGPSTTIGEQREINPYV